MFLWFLECYLKEEGMTTRQPLSNFPMMVGRDESVDCVIKAPSVSRRHLQINRKGNKLEVTDLNSSNGTYVNHRRITEPTTVEHGDVIHMGSAELRVIDDHHGQQQNQWQEDEEDDGSTRFMTQAKLSEQFPLGIQELEQLIAQKSVVMVFQPIIMGADLSRSGYEILGRGSGDSFLNSPLELFRVAESFGLAKELSEVMRNRGVEVAVANNLKGDLLVNTHPDEVTAPDRLLRSLTELRGRFPGTPITVELHEHSVAGDKDLLPHIKRSLDKLEMNLAFDDFGVGQSRLMEMLETKPDLIKFDRALIDQIDKGDTSRLNLLRRLKEMAEELSIATLAECVSNAGEYEVCKTLQFEYYQGFYFARPQTADHFTNS